MKRYYSIIVAGVLFCGCAAEAPPIPPGTIPDQQIVIAEDEQYGHQVLNMLIEKYPLSQNDAEIKRVRNIVDQLTAVLTGPGDPWHVYVLDDVHVKNAAATRGNYVFVWTGMLRQVQTDSELAAILAHEIGHVLAGHTQPTPYEEVNQIISGVAGVVAREVVAAQGPWGIAADLAEILARELINAVLVNPGSQQNELEADQVGLFIMADAGFDPDQAVIFWERVQTDPGFSGFDLPFLSSHPSSEERLEQLRALAPQARERYLQKMKPPPKTEKGGSEWSWGKRKKP